MHCNMVWLKVGCDLSPFGGFQRLKDFNTEIGPYNKNTSDILLPQRKANFNREVYEKSWFWSCHQVPISVIRSLPVTKKSAKFVADNTIYDIFQRHFVLWNGFFVAAKKFVAGIQFCRSATSFGSDIFFMKRPPPPPVSPIHARL